MAARGSTSPDRPNVPGLGPVFLIVFLDILGFSLVLPFLAAEARAMFGTTAFLGTLLGSIDTDSPSAATDIGALMTGVPA